MRAGWLTGIVALMLTSPGLGQAGTERLILQTEPPIGAESSTAVDEPLSLRLRAFIEGYSLLSPEAALAEANALIGEVNSLPTPDYSDEIRDLSWRLTEIRSSLETTVAVSAKDEALSSDECYQGLSLRGFGRDWGQFPLAMRLDSTLTVGDYLCIFLQRDKLTEVSTQGAGLQVVVGDVRFQLQQKKWRTNATLPFYYDPSSSVDGPVKYAVVGVWGPGGYAEVEDFETNFAFLLQLIQLYGAPFVE